MLRYLNTVFLLFILTSASCQEPTTMHLQEWQNNQWVNGIKTSYTYNSIEAILTSHTEQWDTSSSKWYNDSYVDYTNHPDGRMDFYVYQLWDAQLSNWKEYNKISYKYTSNKKKKEELAQLKNSSQWDDYSKTIYFYTPQEWLRTELSLIWNTGTSQWDTTNKIVYSHFSNGDVKSKKDQYWDDFTGSWSNSVQIDYTYYANGLEKTETHKEWNLGQWDSTYRFEYTYNSFDKISQSLQQEMDANNTSWSDMAQTNYTYRADSLLDYYISQQYDNGQWVNQFKSSFSYNEHSTPGSITERTTENLRIFPNPAFDYLYLHTPKLLDEDSNIMILNLNGQPVAVQLKQQNRIDVSQLPPGFYILSLTSEDNRSQTVFQKR